MRQNESASPVHGPVRTCLQACLTFGEQARCHITHKTCSHLLQALKIDGDHVKRNPWRLGDGVDLECPYPWKPRAAPFVGLGLSVERVAAM